MTFSNFTVHIIEGYISNILLVEYEHGLLLLDCGSLNDVKRIEKYCLKNLGRSPEEIKLAVVSHMHPDHSGGANTLRDKYGIPIAAHYKVDNWYSGMGGLLQHKLDCIMAHSVAIRNNRRLERTLFNRSICPDYPLNDMEKLPIFSDWQVLHVPGHTLHDIALYNEKENIMYTADIILNIRGKLLLPLPVLFKSKMTASLERLSTFKPSTLLPGHGEPINISDCPDIFNYMQYLLNKPATGLERRVHLLSIYSPEIWKEFKATRGQGC